jgi:hypothetical protein
MILAIDPGGRNTGVVLRRTPDDLVGWTLIVRQGSARLPDGPYVRRVLGGCLTLLRDADVDPSDRDAYVVGVEGIAYWPERDPKVRRDQRGLYGTAMVLGGILARWPDAIVVDSGRGVANLHPQAYPPPIRPPVNGKGMDRLKDVRAAWDHAHAAETAAKTAAGRPL